MVTDNPAEHGNSRRTCSPNIFAGHSNSRKHSNIFAGHSKSQTYWGKKACESPICLWVTRWLLICFGSCAAEWVVSSLRWSIRYPLFASSYWFYLIGEHRSEYAIGMGFRLRRGWCTITVDLLMSHTRNEESIMKNETDIATCKCRLKPKQSSSHRGP